MRAYKEMHCTSCPETDGIRGESRVYIDQSPCSLEACEKSGRSRCSKVQLNEFFKGQIVEPI